MSSQPCCTNDPSCFCISTFKNNQQEATFWCWAAVTANVFNSMLPAGSKNTMEQCDVVKKIKGTGQGDPCNDANKEAYTDADILNVLDKFKIGDGNTVGRVFQTLVDELKGTGGKAPEPVVMEVDFANGAVHYVAVCGVHQDTQQNVCVADPRYGGDAAEMDFNDFLHNYGYQKDAPHPGGTGVVQYFQKVQRIV